MGKGLPHIYISCSQSSCTWVSSEALLVSVCLSAVIMMDVRFDLSVYLKLHSEPESVKGDGDGEGEVKEEGRRKKGVAMCTRLFSLFLFALPVLCAWVTMSYK